VAILGFGVSLLTAKEPGPAREKPGWVMQKVERVDGMKVAVSEPVLVARSKGFLWFPTLAKTVDGRLLAVMSNYADAATIKPTAGMSWSDDGGLTWSAPVTALYGKTNLSLPSGELRLLPHYLWPDGKDLKGPCVAVAEGSREIRELEDGVRVTGWPRTVGSLDAKLGLGGFVFNGQTVRLKSSTCAMLYGRFEGERFFSLMGAESTDGANWKIRSLIADVRCGFKGSGPSEAAVCRLKDGRLMCVFRNNGNLPYGQTWSSDDGLTWEKPVQMTDVRSVQPSLLVLEGGEVVLTGGRPGVFAWINADGTGKSWQAINLAAKHDAARPSERMLGTAENEEGRRTSSYTEVVSLRSGELIVIYDRLGNGWKAIPEGSAETNSVWVVRVLVERGE
jgi:hypothetical protein